MPIDYKRYPLNWETQIVPAVLKRAQYRCECCGLPNKSTVWSVSMQVKEDGKYKIRCIWFRHEGDAIRENLGAPERRKAVKVVLTIAHLDHDEDNWNVELNRLMAMCQLCHLRYDAKEKYRRSLIN